MKNYVVFNKVIQNTNNELYLIHNNKQLYCKNNEMIILESVLEEARRKRRRTNAFE